MHQESEKSEKLTSHRERQSSSQLVSPRTLLCHPFDLHVDHHLRGGAVAQVRHAILALLDILACLHNTIAAGARAGGGDTLVLESGRRTTFITLVVSSILSVQAERGRWRSHGSPKRLGARDGW